MATAPIRPLTWEPTYAAGAALKKKKKEKEREAENGHAGLDTAKQQIKFKNIGRSSHRGSAVANLASIHEDLGSIPGLSQWVKDLALL